MGESFFRFLSVLALCLFINSVALANEPTPAPQDQGMTVEQFIASLNFQSGVVTLPNNLATLSLPSDFVYLDPKDSERLLVQAWGNTSASDTLGMIFPAESAKNPMTEEAWGVVVTYSDDGHVSDSDADSMNYDDLMAQMKESNVAENEERKTQGYPPFTLVGWAEAPTYDKQSHKFYWAKEFSTDPNAPHTLNYDVRVLGRKGVLTLTAVSSMSQLPQIKSEMAKVITFTQFTNGNLYGDFDATVDKTAEYGLAALVAGGIAAKAGLFGKLAVLLIAMKKFIVIAVLAVVAGLKKLFGRKKDAGSQS